ncbi:MULTISPECIES: DUF3253 domain-containing protein [Asticcacaulis]|uniref:DUF3253 domain-containing protein n=1 Tax=Asticcacaulis TaxID=76890 RepID=UPI001AEA3390|nr:MULTISPECIES: DUF3253 domain-containing protein [Asticcacaulis]MBP2158631.1 hypothetical protein [Asticcacaulis solisilvae]MDR6799677.1 hypothetical protein [Asticcacaulis sp. BE141]
MSSQIEETLLDLLSQVREGESISPNQVAKALDAENWQRELPKVKAVAVGLARQGRLEFVRKGKPVSPDGLKGIYRLRLAVDG